MHARFVKQVVVEDERFWLAYDIFNSRWNKLTQKIFPSMSNHYINCYNAYRRVYGKDPILPQPTPNEMATGNNIV